MKIVPTKIHIIFLLLFMKGRELVFQVVTLFILLSREMTSAREKYIYWYFHDQDTYHIMRVDNYVCLFIWLDLCTLNHDFSF